MSFYIFQGPLHVARPVTLFSYWKPVTKQLPVPIFQFDPDGQGVSLENFSMSLLGPYRDA